MSLQDSVDKYNQLYLMDYFYCNLCLENSDFFQEATVTKFKIVNLKAAQLTMFRMINVLYSIIL